MSGEKHISYIIYCKPLSLLKQRLLIKKTVTKKIPKIFSFKIYFNVIICINI